MTAEQRIAELRRELVDAHSEIRQVIADRDKALKQWAHDHAILVTERRLLRQRVRSLERLLKRSG